MNTLTRRLLWVVIGFGLIVSARANSVVFSTLGPGDSFDTTASWAIEAVGSPLLIAAQFTAQASGNLRTVDLGMSFDQFFGPGMFNVYLYNDARWRPRLDESDLSRLRRFFRALPSLARSYRCLYPAVYR